MLICYINIDKFYFSQMYTPMYILHMYTYGDVHINAKPIAKHHINWANKAFNCIFTLPLTKSRKCKQEAITSTARQQ